MITLNGYEIKPTIFPDGTSQVWKLPEEALDHIIKDHRIKWVFESENEIMHLLQLKSLLTHQRIPCNIHLDMPFLPYGRQDKDISNDTTFALLTFAKLINSMRFTTVKTLDVHCLIALDLFDNIHNIMPIEFIEKAKTITDCDTLAFPDLGASSRYSKLGFKLDIITGNKRRDSKTGYITEYTFYGDPKDKKILIVDDICDGGMTFRILAENLKEAGAKEVHLFVSHGIFSKGVQVLIDSGIDRIFTKDGEVFPSKNTNYLLRSF